MTKQDIFEKLTEKLPESKIEIADMEARVVRQQRRAQRM